MELSMEEFGELKDSICPQIFAINNDNLYFFDKINRDEVRLCVIDRSKGRRIISEMDDNIVLMPMDGHIYTIKFDQNSIVRELDTEGRVINKFILEGIFFDISQDNKGNYIFLGLREDKLCINILNGQGAVINTVYINDVILGCGLRIRGEHLFIGAIAANDSLRLYELNYLGVKMNEWTIYSSRKGRVIEKILNYGPFEIILISDKCNKIAVLNRYDGEVHEIQPEELQLKEFTDINISGDVVFILDGKKVISQPVDDIIFFNPGRKKIGFKIDTGVFSYRYMMYCLEIYKNFKRTIGKYACIGMTFLLLAIIIAAIAKASPGIFLSAVPYYISVLFVIACVASRFKLKKKSERIDRLLSISMDMQTDWIPSQILLGCALFCFIKFIIPVYNVNTFLCITMTLLLSLGIGYQAMNKIRQTNKEYVIELLEDESLEISQYLRSVTAIMNEKKNDKLYISILTESEPSCNIPADWINSRRYIINKDIVVKTKEKEIKAIMDLSQRDLKYSRMSILMDYICFIKSKIGVKEIKIHHFNQKTNTPKKTRAK